MKGDGIGSSLGLRGAPGVSQRDRTSPFAASLQDRNPAGLVALPARLGYAEEGAGICWRPGRVPLVVTSPSSKGKGFGALRSASSLTGPSVLTRRCLVPHVH